LPLGGVQFLAIPDEVPTGSLDRRSRKRLANTDSMRTAAIGLALERGFAATTVEDICDRADVAPSTFFRHFPAKEDAVFGGLRDRLADLLESMDRQPPAVGVRAFLVGAIEDWRQSRRSAELLRSEAELIALEPALLQHLGRILTELEQPVAERLAGRFPTASTVDLRLAAAWFTASIRVVIREWSSGPLDNDVYEVGLAAVAPLSDLLEVTLGPPAPAE
jgi:AcrR family transcriptional regulator